MTDNRIHLAELADDELVRLSGRGDYDAFAELYGRYEQVAYGLALRVIRDTHHAEDAVVEGFVAVWRSAASFNPGRGSARSWILTIVHRRAVDVIRREEKLRRPVETSYEFETGADETAMLREQRLEVQRALRRLPDRERELIELAYYGGFTQSELARQLGLSLGTVKSRMFAGLARLRSLLTETAAELAPELDQAIAG